MSECTENERALIEAVMRLYMEYADDLEGEAKLAAEAVATERASPEAIAAYREACVALAKREAVEKAAGSRISRETARRIRLEVYGGR